MKFKTLLIFLPWLTLGTTSKVDVKAINVKYYNKEYLKEPYFNIAQIDGKRVFNASWPVIKDLRPNLMISADIQLLNEDTKQYSSLHKIDDIDLCESLKNDDFGIKKYIAIGNITDCPWKAGEYKIVEVEDENQEIPPLPAGEFKIETEVKDNNVLLIQLEWLISVTD